MPISYLLSTSITNILHHFLFHQGFNANPFAAASALNSPVMIPPTFFKSRCKFLPVSKRSPDTYRACSRYSSHSRHGSIIPSEQQLPTRRKQQHSIRRVLTSEQNPRGPVSGWRGNGSLKVDSHGLTPVGIRQASASRGSGWLRLLCLRRRAT
jgi:hypothetical protein